MNKKAQWRLWKNAWAVASRENIPRSLKCSAPVKDCHTCWFKRKKKKKEKKRKKRKKEKEKRKKKKLEIRTSLQISSIFIVDNKCNLFFPKIFWAKQNMSAGHRYHLAIYQFMTSDLKECVKHRKNFIYPVFALPHDDNGIQLFHVYGIFHEHIHVQAYSCMSIFHVQDTVKCCMRSSSFNSQSFREALGCGRPYGDGLCCSPWRKSPWHTSAFLL